MRLEAELGGERGPSGTGLVGKALGSSDGSSSAASSSTGMVWARGGGGGADRTWERLSFCSRKHPYLTYLRGEEAQDDLQVLVEVRRAVVEQVALQHGQ